MHANFYHWHEAVAIKPDVNILESRWKAAEKFVAKCTATDVAALLSIALFKGQESEFSTRFGAALVKLEPTFKPDANGELLRVMSTAALYSKMAYFSEAAYAIALGLRAANFPDTRIE